MKRIYFCSLVVVILMATGGCAAVLHKAHTVEAEPLCQTPLPYEDVTSKIKKIEHPLMTTYLIRGDIAETQVYRIAVRGPYVVVGTNRGLLLYDRNECMWRLYDQRFGMPGERVHQVGFISDDELCIEVWNESKEQKDYVMNVGVFLFNLKTNQVKKVDGVQRDVRFVGQNYLLASNLGVTIHELATGHTRSLKKGNSDLMDPEVSAIYPDGDRLWVGSRGTDAGPNADGDSQFEGGGVSELHIVTGKGQQYGVADGLVNSYVSDLAVNADTVWAAHWNESRGLSVLARDSSEWQPLVESVNGIKLGGVRLMLDRKHLWIGQQQGLVRLNTRTLYADHYTQKQGLPGYIVTGIAHDDDRVWISALKYTRGVKRMSGIAVLPRIPENNQ